MKNQLIKAIKIGNIEEVKNFILLGLDINFKVEDGWTPLMYATVGGQLEILILLLEAGANINEQSDSGDTALIKAVLCNHFDVANLLLINNANVDIIDNEGWTALSIAIARGNNKFIKLLTQHKTKTKIRK